MAVFNPASKLRSPLALVSGPWGPRFWGVRFALFDPRRPDPAKAILGGIGAVRPDSSRHADLLEVQYSAAIKGFGPVLYQVAMAWATENGLWLRPSAMSPGSSLQRVLAKPSSSELSAEARQVWRKFVARADIECSSKGCKSSYPPGTTAALARGHAYVDAVAPTVGITPEAARTWLLGVFPMRMMAELSENPDAREQSLAW